MRENLEMEQQKPKLSLLGIFRGEALKPLQIEVGFELKIHYRQMFKNLNFL